MWNDMILMMLPRRQHLRIQPHNDAAFEQKTSHMEKNKDLSLYFKSHITIFCANKCATRRLRTVYEHFSANVTKLYVEELPCPDENVPIILSKLTNLEQLYISRAHWSTKFKFESQSLQMITLQSCLGMKTMRMVCPSLCAFVFDRGILEIPFLEDIGERKLRFIIQSNQHVNVLVKGLNLNNLKLHSCTALSTRVKLSRCLGVSLKFSSKSKMDVVMRKCFYSNVLVEGEKLEKLELVNMKMKVLKLRCTRLQTLDIGSCVIKTQDFRCAGLLAQAPA